MDWEYKREKKASAEDVADIIRDTVSIEDALNVYAPHAKRKGKRCQCPIHNGDGMNFSFTERGYKCFVCNASGDVISLVKEVCELSTRADAMKKINLDFNLRLPLGGEISATQSAELARKREEAGRKRREKAEWEERYQNTLNEWIELDKIIMNTPWDSEKNIQKVCKAKEERARVGCKLDLILASEPR